MNNSESGRYNPSGRNLAPALGTFILAQSGKDGVDERDVQVRKSDPSCLHEENIQDGRPDLVRWAPGSDRMVCSGADAFYVALAAT